MSLKGSRRGRGGEWGAGFGTSDLLCGVPGIGTLGNAGTGRTAPAEALGEVANRLQGLSAEWGRVHSVAR